MGDCASWEGAGATLFELAWPELVWPELGGPELGLLGTLAAGSEGFEAVAVDVAMIDSSDSFSNETRISALGMKRRPRTVQLLMKMVPERTKAVVSALEERVNWSTGMAMRRICRLLARTRLM